MNTSVSFLSLLFLIFLTLKLCNVIAWSWWWISAPLWIPWGIVFIVLLLCFLCAFIEDTL